LHREDLRRLEGQLRRGPGADPRLEKREASTRASENRAGRSARRWTVVRVGELIGRVCRVKYDPSQAWRILRRLGWSFHPRGPQSPHHAKIGRDGNPDSPHRAKIGRDGNPDAGPPETPVWRRGGDGWMMTHSSPNRASTPKR